tara:strand:- start:95 stop:346 length:252 start_codon:yes stop_codon:yes gene_type:complete
MRKLKDMKTLYEKLDEQVKQNLKKSLIKYHYGPRKVIAELHRYNNYNNLTINMINDLCLYGDVNTWRWDNLDWKYGDKLFADV